MRLFSLFTLILLTSCQKNDAVKVYSVEEYYKVKKENPKVEIIISDTVCEFQIKKAKKDIENDSLVFDSYHYTPEVVEELKVLLKPFKIYPRYANSSSISPIAGFKNQCYQETIRNELSSRFNKTWIDSMERVALKNYIIKNPTKPYIENGIDLREKYLTLK
ncbi:hypothetical protein [Flavobacterium mekongense]|uniref:hypothetical protein n=1 Tax=Flavobacterium mekongense TaxID=3379707 RepID=UPI00399B1F53